MVGTFIIMITHIIFNNIYSSDLPDQKLPLYTTGCESNNHTTDSITNFNIDNTNFIKAKTDWKNSDDSFGIKVLSISYMWYSGVGCVLSVCLGILCSLVFNLIDEYRNTSRSKTQIPSNCISPPILKLLQKFFPNASLKWIEFYSTAGKQEQEEQNEQITKEL